MRRRSIVEAAAEVGVASSLRQGLARDDEARAQSRALLDRNNEPVVGTADVAHGCEAAHEHAPHDIGGAGRHQRVGKGGASAETGDAGHHMHMAVYQARQERSALEIDDAGGR